MGLIGRRSSGKTSGFHGFHLQYCTAELNEADADVQDDPWKQDQPGIESIQWIAFELIFDNALQPTAVGGGGFVPAR
jgi:hypothetical protein